MKKIPRLVEGESYPSAFSTEWMNMIVDTCNAVRFMKGAGGITVIYGDSGYIIDGSGSFDVGTNATGSASGSSSGSITYAGRDTWL